MANNNVNKNANNYQNEKKKKNEGGRNFNMEDLYEVKTINRTRLKTKQEDCEELPFYLKLNTKSILDKAIRPSLIKQPANIGVIDVRHSLEYLNPIQSPTFKDYDVPSEDEWNLRRRKYEPGPGTFNPNFAYYEQTPGGYFSKNRTIFNETNNENVAVSHIGPGFYKSTLGKFSQVTSTTSGLFSKLPNINSTEVAYRNGLKTNGPVFIFPKRHERCSVNYNVNPALSRKSYDITPGPTSYDPNAAHAFGTKGGFKIREETKLTKQVKEMKKLLDDPKDYYVKLAQNSEYDVNQKYSKPSKLLIIQNALERCNNKILRILDNASKNELKRQKAQQVQRNQLSCINNYGEFKSHQFQMHQQEEKYNADRKLQEREIKCLLRKQKQLRHICKKLRQKNVGSAIKKHNSILDINNKHATYTNDLDRWLKDMKMTSLITKKKDNIAENSEKNDKYYMVEEEIDDVRVDKKTTNNIDDYYGKMKTIFQNHGAILWPTSRTLL